MAHSHDHKSTYRLLHSADEVERVLKNEAYPPTLIADAYRTLEQRFHLDFSAAIRLLECLPVFLSGQKHKRIRKDMATSMAAVRIEQELAISKYIVHLDDLLIPNQTIDLKNNFIKPLWRHLVNFNHQFSSEYLNLVEEIPYLFYAKLSIKRRIEINQRIAQYISTIDAEDEKEWIRLGQHVLGFTPLIESFTISLYDIFIKNQGIALSDIHYPSAIPISAVRTTDRWVGDEVVRCPLHSNQYSNEINQKYMFGVGPHACLGGPISRFIWPLVTQRLSLSPLIINDVALSCAYPSLMNMDTGEVDFDQMNDPFVRTQNFQLTLRSA
jgi:hypothetical protein